MTKRLKKLLRTLMLIGIVIVGVYAFNMYSTFEKTETPEQFVNRLSEFYVFSGYDKKSLYEQDIERLQEYKQIALDKLTYRQTLDYIAIQNKKKTGLIDNDWLNLIDETIMLAIEGKDSILPPEYLTIDTATAIDKPIPTASELVFQNLLK